MKIYNFVKCSFVDYPGKIAIVLFTRGCNIHCRYCHNAHIIPFDGPTIVTEEQVWDYIKKRDGLIQGLVISGGEPTIQPDLLDFLKLLRKTKYNVKLDTNGYRPDIVKKVIDAGLVDFIAMDIKAPPNKYEKITQVHFPEKNINESIKLIKESGLPHQFRTTFDKRFLNTGDLDKIRAWIQDDSYVVNPCILRDKNGNPLNE